MNVSLRKRDFDAVGPECLENPVIDFTAEDFGDLDMRSGPDPEFKIKGAVPESREDNVRPGVVEYRRVVFGNPEKNVMDFFRVGFV